MMLVFLLVRASGGFWTLKQKCLGARPNWLLKYYRLLWNLLMRYNGSFIEYETRFADQPLFPHGLKSIFISGDAQIGKDCVIFQQVTIGSNYVVNSKRAGAPIIGDNCLIGAGAQIIGAVKIGNNCRVGAGCVVFEDVPDNAVVVTSPARIIPRDKPSPAQFYAFRDGAWWYYADSSWVKETDSGSIGFLEKARTSAWTKQPIP